MRYSFADCVLDTDCHELRGAAESVKPQPKAYQVLLDLALGRRQPVALLRAHAAMGEILFHSGEPAPAREHLEEGLRLYRRQRRQPHASQAPSVVCLCYAALLHWLLGCPR